jgi:hypothetical protein
MPKRTPKRPTNGDATIEVTEADVTRASPPPLPTKKEPVESQLVERRIASVVLPVVRAAIRFVKSLESRLETLEQRLAASASRTTAESTDRHVAIA